MDRFSGYERHTSFPERTTCKLSVCKIFSGLSVFICAFVCFVFFLREQKRDSKLATQTLRETRLLVLTIMFNYRSFQLPSYHGVLFAARRRTAVKAECVLICNNT